MPVIESVPDSPRQDLLFELPYSDIIIGCGSGDVVLLGISGGITRGVTYLGIVRGSSVPPGTGAALIGDKVP